MRVARVSNNELQDMFTEAYQSIASDNDINEFEAVCERAVDGGNVTMEVTIFGFAGTPTQTEFEELDGVKEVVVPHTDPNEDAFRFVLDSVYTLNTNDYVAIYKIEAAQAECAPKKSGKAKRSKKSK